ncbi:hypothetical protein V8C44DRAFT_315574 [Trichoderma aethiopicum]
MGRLAKEIRSLIVHFLAKDADNNCRLDALAAVSREWQAEIERYKSAQPRPTTSCIGKLQFITPHNRPRIAISGSTWSLTNTIAPSVRLPVRSHRRSLKMHMPSLTQLTAPSPLHSNISFRPFGHGNPTAI